MMADNTKFSCSMAGPAGVTLNNDSLQLLRNNLLSVSNIHLIREIDAETLM